LEENGAIITIEVGMTDAINLLVVAIVVSHRYSQWWFQLIWSLDEGMLVALTFSGKFVLCVEDSRV
jgi:hypothetical protein